jgi:superfamily II RNA helicase
MEVNTLRSNTQVYNHRLMSQSFVPIKLYRLVNGLKLNLLNSTNNLHSIVLSHRHDKKTVLMALNEAVELESVQADDSVTIHLIEGKVQFKANNQLIVLMKGQLIKVSEKTPYSLTAIEETVILFTIVS